MYMNKNTPQAFPSLDPQFPILHCLSGPFSRKEKSVPFNFARNEKLCRGES
jgi:hypothetical protein